MGAAPTASAGRNRRTVPPRAGGERPAQPFWARAEDELLRSLGTTTAGLPPEVAVRHLAPHARDVLHASPHVSVLPLFLRQFSNPLVPILVAAAAVAALVHETTDSVIILLVLLGSALLTRVQEDRATTVEDIARFVAAGAVAVWDDSIPATRQAP